MKQHITKEQWDEIGEENQSAYLKTINESAGEKIKGVGPIYPLPTIGQMIEFLGEDLVSMEKMSTAWWLQGWKMVKKDVNIHSGELCDALWEAVKEKLLNND